MIHKSGRGRLRQSLIQRILSIIDLIFTSGISTITRKIKTVSSHVLLARNLCVYVPCGQHKKEDEIVCLMSLYTDSNVDIVVSARTVLESRQSADRASYPIT